MNLLQSLELVLLATAGVSLPTPKARRRALAGPLLYALAAASLTLARGSDAPLASLPVSYSAITAAIFLIAIALPIGFAAASLRDTTWQGFSRILAILAALAGLGLGVRESLPLITQGGVNTLAAIGGLLLAAGLLRFVGPRLAAGLRWADALAFPVRAPASHRWDGASRGLLAATVVAALVACFSPRLDLLLLAVLIGVTTGLLLERRLGRLTRIPLLAPLALLLVAGSSYLLIHVAGDTPLSFRDLLDAPYSSAFEVLTVLLLGLACWVFLGLFPFASVQRGPLSALFAGALLARAAGPILADGWIHWQPIFYLIPAIAAWHAAATRRDEETLVALGTLGLLSESEIAGWCGILIVTGAALVRAVEWLELTGARLGDTGTTLLRLTLVAGAPLLLPLIRGSLEAQAFYTVLAVLGVVGSLFGTRAPTPR
jgi:hypothetical protein